MMPKPRVAILDDYQHVALQCADWGRLDADITVFHEPWRDEDHAAAALAGFEIVSLLRERTKFPASLINRLPKLKLVSMTGHRTSTLDVAACTARGILVTYTSSPDSVATAELAIGLMISCARAISAADHNMKTGLFQDHLPLGIPLAGKRLGVVGLGKLGGQVARVGLAMGMDVVAWSQNLTAEAAAAKGARRVDKAELFTSSDVVSLHLALSDRSRGIVTAADLAALKPGGIFINTARAGLVDEAALLATLRAGRIIAGLDVYSVEPLPAEHPLRQLKNVVLTPHLGYLVEDALKHYLSHSAENIAAFLAGSPINVSNPEVLTPRE
jgi:phosphoglycerate dehydrogenase-like enzyme